MAYGDGLKLCWEAFERLKEGRPQLKEHVGLAAKDITPAKVSKEAGKDAGYLKWKRDNHKPLITAIEGYVKEQSASDSCKSSDNEKVRQATVRASKAKDEKELAEARMHFVLGENLKLAAKVRELEKELAKYRSGNVASMTGYPN
ncbi:hypothetical protein [uncultured Pseudoalteromonas sp.]|uniref:hypothetical protein n=1 Tax=uncultured Pseudoalteromonas sp. TaxID=114053 RepID=UPI0032B29453